MESLFYSTSKQMQAHDDLRSPAGFIKEFAAHRYIFIAMYIQ